MENYDVYYKKTQLAARNDFNGLLYKAMFIVC